MKKIKSVQEKLLEKGILSEPVLIDPDWYGKHLREKARLEENARKEEEERIDKLVCPFCKSTDKEHVIKSENNGVYGPGYSSRLIDEYFVCKKCGIMYKDITKIKK